MILLFQGFKQTYFFIFGKKHGLFIDKNLAGKEKENFRENDKTNKLLYYLIN